MLFWPPKTPLLIIKTGVYRGYTLLFLFLLKNIDCGYTLEPPQRDGSNEYPQSLFLAEIWKISEFLSENVQVMAVKFSIYIWTMKGNTLHYLIWNYIHMEPYRCSVNFSYLWPLRTDTLFALQISVEHDLKHDNLKTHFSVTIFLLSKGSSLLQLALLRKRFECILFLSAVKVAMLFLYWWYVYFNCNGISLWT